jgi:cell division protein FtsN
MVCTKNVSALGGGDDEDPPRPFRQVKGKTVYLEQQEGCKKRHLDRAARAALAAAAAEQAERGGQLQISSDQIAYRVRQLASRPRSTAPSTPTTATTPPPTSPAPVTPKPSTTSAIPTTSTTPASTTPPPAPFPLHPFHLPASRSEMRPRCDH